MRWNAWMRVVAMSGLALGLAACSKPSPVEVVAQGIDDQNIFVVLREADVSGPVRAETTNGAVHIWVVATDHPVPPAVCETNRADGTVKVLVRRPAPKDGGVIHVYLDGRSLGDWSR